MGRSNMKRYPLKPETNLVKYLDRLSQKERLILCNCINTVGKVNDEPEIHLGLLPFYNHTKAVRACHTIISVSSGPTRLVKQIKAKLTSDETALFSGASAFVRFPMRLSDAKVYRYFGPHPERGKPLSILPKEKVTVGVKFSLPKKDYVPDKDVLVTPCVTLKRQTKNYWQVEVLAKCQHTVEQWLLDHCQL